MSDINRNVTDDAVNIILSDPLRDRCIRVARVTKFLYFFSMFFSTFWG